MRMCCRLVDTYRPYLTQFTNQTNFLSAYLSFSPSSHHSPFFFLRLSRFVSQSIYCLTQVVLTAARKRTPQTSTLPQGMFSFLANTLVTRELCFSPQASLSVLGFVLIYDEYKFCLLSPDSTRVDMLRKRYN
mgnify:CR=1 FL=1